MVGKTIRAGVAKALENGGSGLKLTATLTANIPKRNNGQPRRLTWAGTGNQWHSAPTTLTVNEGEEVTFADVPATNSTGWRLDGQAPELGPTDHVFTYTLSVSAKQGAKTTSMLTATFTIAENDPSSIDVDTLMEATTASGAVVSIVDNWTALTEAAAASAAAAEVAAAGNDAGVSALIETPATATRTALDAAIAAEASSALTPAYRAIQTGWDPPISRAGSFAALSRWLRATALHAVSGSAALVILTDSTGTNTSAGDGDGWPQILAEQIAAAYPNATVRLRRFDHAATLKMLPATVLHESPLGRPKYRVGTNGFYFLTAPYGRAGLVSAATLLATDDLDLRIKFSGKHADLDGQSIPLITNWGPTSDPADRGIELYMGTTSTLSIRVATSTTAWATFNSTAALPYVDDNPIWVRAVLDRDNGAAGKTVTFYYSTDDAATWTQLGTPVTVAGVLSGVNDTPDWYWEVGTVRGGMTYSLSTTATGGTYRLRWYPDNATYIPGVLYETADLAYNADAATIQAAIQAIPHPALAGATVTGTGTKTITFTTPVRYATTVTTALTGGTLNLGATNFARPFDVYEIEIRKGIDGPAVGPTQVWDWEISPSRVGYSGGPLLDIVNFAFSGKSVQNFIAEPYLSWAAVHRGQLATIIATSHNEGQNVGAGFTAMLDTLADAILARVPTTALAVGTENPQVPPSVVIPEQSARSAQIAAWAARRGMTVVDTFTAFLDDPRWEADGGVLLADDRHPSHEAHASIIAPMMLRAIQTGA